MKSNIIKLNSLILLLLIIVAGCEKEFLETDPAKIILGKWEIIEMSGESVEKPTGYMEFLPDSVLREFDYEKSRFRYKKYWIDSLLHENVFTPDGTEIPFFEYYYSFTDKNNKMHLQFKNLIAWHKNFTYKRIE